MFLRRIGISRFSSFDKGKEYFKDGYVEKIWKEGDEYRAIVRGTHPYQVSLKFDGDELTYNCSCPFELDGACKHVVSAIFAFASDRKFAVEPSKKRVEKNEAEYALSCLDIETKSNLSAEESSLLAFLYFLAEDWQAFEQISLKNLKENPALTVDLLKYYQKNKQKDRIIQISDQALANLMHKDRDDDYSYPRQLVSNREIEIQIRRFLKGIFSLQKEYKTAIVNLERLFLLTGELPDYKELIKNYQDRAEKERFWPVIKKYFGDEYEVKTVFKIFKLEDQKQEILELINKYPQVDCFPDMIVFIHKDFPHECFMVYRKKIENILTETDVKRYSEAAYHLKRMKEIGLNGDFADFIGWIKTTYWRRKKLLEELQENDL